MPRRKHLAAVPSASLGFELTDATFEQWWSTALLPTDADEFVHILGGNKLGARFVCALNWFTSIDARQLSADLIVRAYCAARKVPADIMVETMREHKTRLDAQFLYDDPSVTSLLERLQYRSRAIAMERVATRTFETVEKLYTNADKEIDPDLRLGMQKAALVASTTLMSIDERRHSGEARRRENQAYRNSLEMSRERLSNDSSPPTLDEAKHTILALRERFGADVLRELVAGALPMPAAQPGEPQPETIEQ